MAVDDRLAFETSAALTVEELLSILIRMTPIAGEESPIAVYVDLDDISFHHQEAPKIVTISGSGVPTLTLSDGAIATYDAKESNLADGELIDLFHERNRVRGELDEVRAKLRGWLTHI